ncbi:MAG: hypothetical protein VKJ05_06725 [Synechococcaceae cyanobacterium]|nr:hypothetical protein [Synechococcaceae cyanobacterium]
MPSLSPLQQYAIVTANYWAFTLTDGALRMLVVFHFHALGYSSLEIALLFLFYWVAILTRSKNALKGVGFFLGGLLLTSLGFNAAVAVMAAGLFVAFLGSLVLPAEIGRMKKKPAFRALFAQSSGINTLSLARFFLFGARDVWFVVALPVFLQAALGWRFWEVGGFLGLWVIGYGIVQASAPALRRSWGQSAPPGVSAVSFWSALLSAIPALLAISLWREVAAPGLVVVVGLAAFAVVFAVVFAMNSSIHSYMVLAYADAGALFLVGGGGSGGMQACLWGSALLVALSWFTSLRLPAPPRSPQPAPATG